MAMSSTTHTKTAAGKIFLVSGLSSGREVFLGKAIDEPYEERVTLEGKLFSFVPPGFLVARPFQTTTSFHLKDAQYCVQHVTNPKAHEEAVQLLNLSIGHVGRSAFPLLYRWIETATAPITGSFPAFNAQTNGFSQPQLIGTFGTERFGAGFGYVHPFHGLYQGFLSTIEQFRRALFHARQVTSTRELDRVAELEGEIAIEIGKVANQIAVKFHQLATKETELFTYLEAFQGSELSFAQVRNSMTGWLYLFDQVHSAKAWARRTGKVNLVREFNTLIKEGIFGLNEVILEHCNALDTLIAETFTQYGISYEIYGELSPFTAYSVPVPTGYSRESAHTLVGAGT
jgi:hypothetical protein